jgi:uracil-DNA glycosylase
MTTNIDPVWKNELNEEFQKPYFQELLKFLEQEYQNNICYPPQDEIFSALNHATFDNVKVVILGQDPYHGPGQAHGLCFSVTDGIAHPPSLKNIFKELESDIEKPIPTSGSLVQWADQGVLLLNAVLTVRQGQANSHQKKGWEKFTDKVIQVISEKKENVVFLLWGSYAHKKGAKIDANKHLVLTSGHPSPLSANRGYWFGNQHFSKTNEYLLSHGKTPINW